MLYMRHKHVNNEGFHFGLCHDPEQHSDWASSQLSIHDIPDWLLDSSLAVMPIRATGTAKPTQQSAARCRPIERPSSFSSTVCVTHALCEGSVGTRTLLWPPFTSVRQQCEHTLNTYSLALHSVCTGTGIHGPDYSHDKTTRHQQSLPETSTLTFKR